MDIEERALNKNHRIYEVDSGSERNLIGFASLETAIEIHGDNIKTIDSVAGIITIEKYEKSFRCPECDSSNWLDRIFVDRSGNHFDDVECFECGHIMYEGTSEWYEYHGLDSDIETDEEPPCNCCSCMKFRNDNPDGIFDPKHD